MMRSRQVRAIEITVLIIAAIFGLSWLVSWSMFHHPHIALPILVFGVVYWIYKSTLNELK